MCRDEASGDGHESCEARILLKDQLRAENETGWREMRRWKKKGLVEGSSGVWCIKISAKGQERR